MGLLIFYAVFSIAFSFLCSIWESVLLSITPGYAQMRIEEGGAVGESIKEFKSNIDRPLAAILTLNTIAHTVGAILVGVQAEAVYGNGGIDVLGISIPITGVVASIMTLLILIVSEIIPKTLGHSYWKQLTPFTVRGLNVIIFLLAPLVWLSQIITRLFNKNKAKSVFSRAEFSAIADLGATQGLYRDGESLIIKNLLQLQNMKVTKIMTPRTVVTAADQSMSVQEFYDSQPNLRYSRIPVYTSSIDDTNGYVLKNDIQEYIIQKKGDTPLSELRRNLLPVPENANITTVYDKLMSQREHIAVVVDEFGGMSGVVTAEDVIETILGFEILDEVDAVEDLQKVARKRWKARAKREGLDEDLIN